MEAAEIVDTHCHLYLEEFGPDMENILLRAEQEGVSRIYLPSIDTANMDALLGLEEKYPGKCFSMMGIHPCYIKENYEEELRSVEKWLERRSFAAVGEIGLDYYWDRTFDKEQLIAFERQIQLALRYNLPIVIHSRNAIEECIETVRRYQQGGLRGVFHCFTGTNDQAKAIIDLGFFLGIGGVITYKNSSLPDVAAAVSADHLVLETDAPYLSPAPFRGKRNEPSYLKYILAKIAAVKGIKEEELARITTANAIRLFGK